jgi:hypothetical protein
MSSEPVDVFQEEQPVIVDGDLIEAAKENIQPLALVAERPHSLPSSPRPMHNASLNSQQRGTVYEST